MKKLNSKKSGFNKKYIYRRLKESWPFYVMLLPALIYIIIFYYGPMYGVQIAFRDYRASKGIWGSPWVGLKHFIRFVEFPNFGKYLWNTLKINLISLSTFPCAIIFALMLNELRNEKFKKAIQMITYIPHFLTEVVVCALVILLLDRQFGPIMALVDLLGGERTNLLASASAFPFIYVLMELWQGLGWSTILYISALSAISPDQVEAAQLDGANRLQVIHHVYIPCIMPTIVITFIMRMGSLLGIGYSKILLLQNDLNLDASTVLSTYTYEVGMVGGQYSFSSAIGLFNNLINITLLLVTNWIARKVTETSLF